MAPTHLATLPTTRHNRRVTETATNTKPDADTKPGPGKLRVAVIGLGGMGTFHAGLFTGRADAQVTVVSDPFHPDLAALATELGADIVGEPLAVAGDDRVDAAIIASPDETHAELALSMIAAGKPVLCEKPLATSVADGRRVVEADEAREQRLVQLGFMREYDDAHRQLVAALADLGPIHHLRCGHINTPSAPRSLDVIVGQSMVHEIHTVRHVTGAEVSTATASVSVDDSGAIRHVVALLGLSNGGHATLEFDDAGFAYDVSVEVTAEKGVVVLGCQLQAEVRIDGQRRVDIGTDWFARFAQAYRSEIDAWVTAARTGGATGPTARDGLAAQQVVEAILQSAATGQTVAVAP